MRNGLTGSLGCCRNMNNIAYAIWIESLESPVIKGQVIDLIKELRQSVKEPKLYLLSFQPFYLFFLRRFSPQRDLLEQLRSELKPYDIDLSVIPVLYRSRWFFAKWYQLPMVLIQTFPVLFYYSAVKKVKLIHCRSYPLTLSALMIKKFLRIKVIFDPRSPFPEENVISGRWTYRSFSYKIWKQLERKYILDSDVSIAIAGSYTNYFREVIKDAKIVEIPNNVDLTKFVVDKEFRNFFRSKMGINKNDIVFVYSGSLGNHWNNPRIYAEFIIKLRDLGLNHKFLFVTPNIDELEKVFIQYGIGTHEYFAVSADLSKVHLYLSSADFGLNLISKPDIRMSIKTVEYLSIGLPIIINSDLKGGKELVEKHNVGIVIELNDFSLSKLKNFILNCDDNFRMRCSGVARQKFSTKRVASQYGEIYLDLLNRT